MASKVDLKFVFANHDGLIVEQTVDVKTNVLQLKQDLIQNWPEKLQTVEGTAFIRLICMGHGILQDSKTLEECRVPVFPSHATPINVSIRPKDIKIPEKVKSPAPAPGEESRSNACLCIIM